jgi:microcompartment protein CcmK/EutM
MIFGQVIGTVVSSRRSDGMEGVKYLLVRTCNHRGDAGRNCIVAMDLVGAGTGEMVIVAQGSSARQTGRTYEKPIDAVIAGIVDLVEAEGEEVFRK